MTSKGILLMGLVFNMVGTAILFFFGYPQPSHDDSVTIEVEDNTVFTDGTSAKSIKEKIRKRKLIYRIMSSVGMGLVFIGFGIQLLAVLNGEQ